MIFTAQYHVPGEKRIENGTLGTVIDTSRDEDKLTINTKEPKPRDIDVNTKDFSDLSLAYAVHVYKAQGLTAEKTTILTGSWQTDREHTYVAVSRAREQTDIHITREDLGEQGLDPGAIERLAERMAESRAQEASITKQPAERTPAAEQGRDPTTEITNEPTRDREISAATQIDPAPSTDASREHDEEQLHAVVERDERDRGTDQLAREPNELDIDQDRDNDLGFGIE